MKIDCSPRRIHAAVYKILHHSAARTRSKPRNTAPPEHRHQLADAQTRQTNNQPRTKLRQPRTSTVRYPRSTRIDSRQHQHWRPYTTNIDHKPSQNAAFARFPSHPPSPALFISIFPSHHIISQHRHYQSHSPFFYHLSSLSLAQ